MNSESYKYSSIDVAMYILTAAREKRIVINMTKLQKLLYVAYGIYLAVRGERLTDEHPQAWPYGPVFPSTRNHLLDYNFTNNSMGSNDTTAQKFHEDTELNSLVDLVFRSFGRWTAGQLTTWSHEQGSPWEKTKCTPGFMWGQTIPDEYIKEYFSKILVQDEKQQNK